MEGGATANESPPSPSFQDSLQILLTKGLVALVVFLHLHCNLINGGLELGGHLPPPLLFFLLTKLALLLNHTHTHSSRNHYAGAYTSLPQQPCESKGSYCTSPTKETIR